MELLDVLTPEGHITGIQKPKHEVHRDGDWHASVHVWIRNLRGDWLLQRRAPRKENDPNLWDTSVAGHIAAGEGARAAALREVEEEIGLRIPTQALIPCFYAPEPRVLNQGSYIDNEWHHIFAVQQDVDLNTLHLQVEEVAEVRWWTTAQFQAAVETRSAVLVPHWEGFTRILTEFPIQ